MSDASSTEVLLIGAGAAGLSAAIWLHDLNIPFRWSDSSGKPGGILQRVNNRITNYPGITAGDGRAMIEALAAHLRDLDLHSSIREERIDKLELPSDDDAPLRATLDGERLPFPAAIVATGTRYRRLGVPGEKEGLGDYISQSSAGDGHHFAGQPVAVVGGGDAGFENALRLAGQGCAVTMLLRSSDHRARPDFVRAAQRHPSIHIAPIPSIIERVEKRPEGGCRLNLEQRGDSVDLEVAALFVRIGVEPIAPQGLEELERDERGFLLVDRRCQTSEPRVFAAGDITATPLRSIATAVGDGARAARSVGEFLNYL